MNPSTTIQKIYHDNNCITGLKANDKDIYFGSQDIVVSTLPLIKTSSLLGHESNLKYRGVVLVYFHINLTNPFPKGIDFLYFDDHGIIFTRLSDQNTFVASPDGNTTVICCEIPYTVGDSVDLQPENALIEKAIEDLLNVSVLNSTSEILGSYIHKLPRVYPMYLSGYRDLLSETTAFVSSFSNLYTLGSLAEFAYSDLQILFAKSRDLATTISSKTFKINKVGFHKNFYSIPSAKSLLGIDLSESADELFLIAEIGLNHNGCVSSCKKLISTAKDAGFNAVKLQTYKASQRSSISGNTSKYAEKILGIEETDYEMFDRLSFDIDQTKEIFNYAHNIGMPIFSAPFDVESLELLIDLDTSIIKIASMENTNSQLLSKVSESSLPTIISTGMSSLGDIEYALSFFNSSNSFISLLHCVSSYPATANTLICEQLKQ